MTLRDWRKKHDISAEELAFRCDIRPSTLYCYENGARRPRLEVAQRIETVTRGEVTAASLLGLTGKSKHRAMREEAAEFRGRSNLSSALGLSASELAEARELGLDVETVAATGATKALAEARARSWREKYRPQIEAKKRWIEKHGTLAEQLGLI